VFGAAFTTASDKLSGIQQKIMDELSMLDQIFTLTRKLDLPAKAKMTIAKVSMGLNLY